MKFLSLLVPFAFLCSCKAQSPKIPLATDENTLLWEVSGKGIKTSYLFGTFHLMCSDAIIFSNHLKTALKASEEVYFEMDLDDAANTLGAMLFMNMKDGKQLKDLYSPQEYERLSSFFTDSLHTPIALMQRMKPLFLQSLLYQKMISCKQMSGVEMELMKMAKANKKEIKGFETIQFQASVFDSIPYDVQAKALLNNIDSMPKYSLEFDEMVAVYTSQNLKELENAFTKSEFGEGENKELLLDNRNRNWIQQLKKILPEKNVFIAVGAGHLVGNMGMIALLQKEGFTVKPLLNK